MNARLAARKAYPYRALAYARYGICVRCRQWGWVRARVRGGYVCESCFDTGGAPGRRPTINGRSDP